MHLAVHEAARDKTVVILCPASPCARELNGPQISTGWAVIFSLEYDWKSKWMWYTLKYKAEEGNGLRVGFCAGVCGEWQSAQGKAGSGERKCIKSGSIIHCQLHVVLYHRPGSFNRERRGFLHRLPLCFLIENKHGFSLLQKKGEGFQLAVDREH